jgi:hypothetical protein
MLCNFSGSLLQDAMHANAVPKGASQRIVLLRLLAVATLIDVQEEIHCLQNSVNVFISAKAGQRGKLWNQFLMRAVPRVISEDEVA